MAHLARSTESARGDNPDGFPGRRVHRHRLSKRKKGSFWREVPILVLTALVLTFLIQTFLARVYVIPSASMEPTLHGCPGCTNDRVLVDKLTYRFGDPRPGDVVVFRGTDSWASEFTSQRSDNILIRGLQQAGSLVGLAPPDERDFVKRVIAVGGQTVECRTATGLTVDSKKLNEPYLDPTTMMADPAIYPCLGNEFGPVKVPDGRIWVMGDNRTHSADSRAHCANLPADAQRGLLCTGDPMEGTVPVHNVIGKAQFIAWPPSRWGGVDSVNPQTSH